MDRTKSQAVNYAFEVIPMMFHSQTTDFMTYLDRDGKQFLEFWWNYIGDQLPEEQHRSFDGMDFYLMELDSGNKMVILTLPPPQDEGEAFYLLLIAKPERRFAWVRLPSTRVLALVNKANPDDPEETELADITPRGNYVRIRKGPAPSLQNMTDIAKSIIEQHPA